MPPTPATAALPAALLPSAMAEVALRVGAVDFVAVLLRLPGVAMVASEKRQSGTTLATPEAPAPVETVEAALLALLTQGAALPIGDDGRVTVRVGGRVVVDRRFAVGLARVDDAVDQAMVALWPTLAATSPEAAAAMASAWLSAGAAA